ncbi:peptidase M48 [Thiomicrospira aerophila AL3]|uniref:Peptidase M48 n=1 Tax=Thiomicrospira aerophila AL3 TaxID=717772 RepID=W0DQ35_9GAMM|nr:M48 family metalloprotease [Thiomicrospira aerophila]AHF00577.1 peptidase M48 [Thiomicrospira aerophila AL3]
MQKSLISCFILLFCLSSGSKAHSPAQSLPDLGSPGLVLYDRNMEIDLGRAFLTALHTEYDMTTDPFVVEYIRQIGQRLISHTADGRNYRFFVINRPEINAFAGPDGIIGINTGLILAAATEDELASVIAHEIAHITQEHLSRRFEQFEQGNMASLASLLAAILIGTQDPSAGIATFIGGSSLAIQNQLRFSRIHEHEADSMGIQLLSKAGYNPSALARFFDNLHRQHNHTNRPPEILLTHPVTERRTALALARAEQLRSTEEQRLNLKLIQARLNPSRLETRGLSSNEQLALTCYQQYLSNQNSLTCLTEATNTLPNNRLLKIALADTQDKLEQNPTNLIKISNIYPQDNALAFTLANHYISRQNIDLAINTLIEQSKKTNAKIELFNKISELYNQQQKTAHALYFQALRETEIGNLRRARHLLMRAKENTDERDLLLKINNLNEKIRE